VLDLEGEEHFVQLALAVFSEERKKLRATCMVMVLAPWRGASDEVGVGARSTPT